ncbi:MAG: prolipoprotein diacylglyceryl transferase [Candidatus Pacebacteria bacterium]|nr:prolipoprotein diacylglyceryl transferase [Candidatus Paceibacterota bacterium]
MFHLYGFILGFAIVAGMHASEWFIQKQRFNIEKKMFERGSLWAIVFGLIGARVYHLATDWSIYAGKSMLSLFAVWNGGLGIYGAIVGGIAGLSVFLYRNQLFHAKNIRDFLNALAFGLPLGQAIGRWGNYGNGELMGKETMLPWGVSTSFDGQKFHPLFLYESIAVAMFWIVSLWCVKKNVRHITIRLFVFYIMWYGIIRFFLDFLRPNPAIVGSLTVAQWWSILAVVSGIVIEFKLRKEYET